MPRKTFTSMAAAAVMLVSSVMGVTALRSPDASADATPGAGSGSQEIVLETVPVDAVGETIVLVLAAQAAPDRAQAARDAINARFGELQGFSIDAADNYEVLGSFTQISPEAVTVPCAELDCPGDADTVAELQPVKLELLPNTSFALEHGKSLVVTGFRTKRGAEEFLELARAVGVSGLVIVQARKLGGGDIGLGQEPHPNGSGPLLGPLPDQERYQQ